jgi:hypothetical protein
MDENAELSSLFPFHDWRGSKRPMQGNYRRIFLNIFIMLAVIGAGISPACKFISRQSTWMEICGAEGIKKILVAADDVPADENKDHARDDTCAFCFTHASVKIISAKAVDAINPAEKILRPSYAISRNDFSSFDQTISFPRGPPVLL